MHRRFSGTVPGDYQLQALRRGPRIQRFWHRNKLKVMQQILHISPIDLVVDIGCGSGNLTFQSAQLARLSVGLDVSEEAVRFCTSLSQGTRCVFACASGDAIPLSDSCADIVLLVEVMEHLNSPFDFLLEIWRVLKDGGRIFVTTPNYAFPSMWPILEWLADHSGLVPRMRGEQHVQKLRPGTLAEILKQAGFEIGRVGTFYHLSLLASIISEIWADQLVAREVESGRLYGSIIYCVARKSG